MKKLFIITSAFISLYSFAQKKAPDNWQTLDPKADKAYGTGSEQAYKTLTGKTPKTVIVAVIDSGIEVDHEDLKDVMWKNAGEIPDNGIDDDKNGYIDDVYGWSFLGGKNGDINYEATELARLYQKGVKKFKWMDTTNLNAQQTKEYEEFKIIKNKFLTEQSKQEQQLKSIEMVANFLDKVKNQNNGVLSKDALKKYTPENETEKQLKKGLKLAFTLGLDVKELETQIAEGGKMIGNMYKYNKLDSDSMRTYIVGDDVNNPNEKYYGCNRVEGPDALHGSHVAGIIAATRGNNIGIEGIANSVKIMAIRAVPNGDERDKDVANAIRYAVDNGASIINMSFGKYHSPDKKLVDEAVKYAQSKDVLLIHAAGNESKNNDIELSFPTRELDGGEVASNWMQIGASAYKGDKNIIGSFSNYGQKKVDLFAPGVGIYSTIPDNKYINESGTSMAAPSTAGVAAIIRSYFPELKAEEVKAVLMKTVVPFKGSVVVPGSKKEKKKVAELCVAGGFVNANNAVMELMGLNQNQKKK
ncbi:MAG: S8 family peptidase [Bacteroidia bacterium]|nr:S8 family peptidase [Bacteroidia bacterium]